MADEFLLSHYNSVIEALNKAGLKLKNEGFGRNLKATTTETQYVVYLTDEYIGGNQSTLKKIIEDACPILEYIAHHPITYRKQGNVITELWVFVKQAKQ